MVQKSHNPENFWHDLKRRKVIRVATVYAAAAFIILQLVDIIANPLQLPDWTLTFMIVLLCVGFIIAVLLSWIYDITPSGVKKTRSIGDVKHNEVLKPPSSGGWRIATYISIVVIVALIAYNLFNKGRVNADFAKLEKSIAVLPFINDSPSDSNQYFINGIMDEILNNLQKIKDFRVLSRTSTDQYQGQDRPTIPEIAKKLGVNYIVEGSGQKYGNRFRLRVQLIAANNEKHLWAESYEQELQGTKDIFNIQSRIAQLIASELKATITPEEKQLIEKIPTANLTAYDFYQRGREEYAKYWNDDNNNVALQKAEELYHKSLRYDSTFAPAYSGLARVYWEKNYLKGKEYLSKNFGDSIIILTKLALSFDDHLSEPYTIRGTYYREIGKPEQAIEEFDKAIKLNPNDWMAYYEKGMSYFSTDLVNWINYLLKAVSINRGRELTGVLNELGWAYMNAGFPDKARQTFQEKLKLDGDSLSYYDYLASTEFWFTNFNKSLEYAEKGYAIDSTNVDILNDLGGVYAWLGQYKESLKYYKKWFEKLTTQGEVNINNMQRLGYAYWQCGFIEEAKYYFNLQIKYCDRMIELKRFVYGEYAYYDLAGVYAFRGEKDKAYKNIRIFNQIQKVNIQALTLIKTDPLFNSIRNEPEFQQIVRDIEAKYQAEHERVRKWLEKQGTLE